MTSGIHHITGITANVQANIDFYAGFLSLTLVKQTAGSADAEQLHLFYGDGLGSPGSLLTFLVWEAAGRGRTGVGQVSEVALAVSPDTIGDWLTRAIAANVPLEGPTREFGEPVLRLKDPDGLIIKLVGVDLPTPAPTPNAPARLRGITVLTDKAGETAQFLTRFGYRYAERKAVTQRMLSDTDVVDVREAPGFVQSVPGAGVLDHVAFRARDTDAVRSLRLSLRAHGPTEVHDRKYFLSLYVRDPAGILMEYATDGPGVTIDEAPGALGQTLILPSGNADRAEDLKAMLPQFTLPGEERFPARELTFIHRVNRPTNPDGSTLVLLHGTGGNEADLMPIARRIAPRATLLGVRGRSTEDGSNRWFRRDDATTYDEADIRSEAEAFAAFVKDAAAGYSLDTDQLVFIGYSNGASLLSAVIQLHPGIVRRAILLRGSAVFKNTQTADLSGIHVLVLEGKDDLIVGNTTTLANDLRAESAEVESQVLAAGHELSAADVVAATEWIRQNVGGTKNIQKPCPFVGHKQGHDRTGPE